MDMHIITTESVNCCCLRVYFSFLIVGRILRLFLPNIVTFVLLPFDAV